MFTAGARIVSPLGASVITSVLGEDRFKVTGPCGLTAVFTRKQLISAQKSTTLFTPQSPSVLIIDSFVSDLTDYNDRVLFPKLKEYFECYLQATITDWLNPTNGQFIDDFTSLQLNRDVTAVIFHENSDIPLELMGDNDTNTVYVMRNRCVVWKQAFSVVSIPKIRMQVFSFNLE